MPYTSTFRVSNSNPLGEDLVWTIESVDGFLASQNPPIHSFSPPYNVGYIGTLRRGESVQVGLTINNIGSLPVGTHTGNIYIEQVGGRGQIKTIEVNLEILPP